MLSLQTAVCNDSDNAVTPPATATPTEGLPEGSALGGGSKGQRPLVGCPGAKPLALPSVQGQSASPSISSARSENARMLATRSALPVSSVMAREKPGPTRAMQVWPAASP